MQYKVIKPITINKLMQAGGNCEEFKTNLNIFMNMDVKTREIDLWEKIDIVDIVPCFRYHPRWENWLVEKGFIEAEGMTFHVGQYFTHEALDMCVMSISRIDGYTVNVIAHQLPGSYEDSNRVTMNGIQVDDCKAITVAEMCKMTGLTVESLNKIRFCNIAAIPRGGE